MAISQVRIVKLKISIPKGSKVPKAVAIPFPPRNLKKIGNICPKQLARAIKPISLGRKPNLNAIAIGSKPFSISNNNTPRADNLPPV